MRTSHHYSVSSAGRLSTWLVAILGLGAYVGLIYGLTVFPLQLELPVPHWATFAVPALAYALLILLFVRRPTILRWLIGTAILSGLHLALAMAREPLSVMLDPALAGRPLPWTLPPPLPEVVGVCLLLVPLRDVLRARPRLARERTSSSTRAASSLRARGSVVPRVPQAAAPEGMESPKEVPVWERSERYRLQADSIPAINVSASRDRDGHITVTLVNLDPQRARTVQAEVRGQKVSGVTGRILTGGTMNAHNTFERPDAVQPAEFRNARLAGNVLRIELPARSVVALQLR